MRLQQLGHGPIEADNLLRPADDQPRHPPQQAADGPARSETASDLGGLGVAVHVPQHQPGVATADPMEQCSEGDKRGSRERNDHILRRGPQQGPGGAEVVTAVVNQAAHQAALAKGRGSQPHNLHTSGRV